MLRKKATVEDYASLDQSVTCPMPYKNPANLEFYGQRHWRPNRLSLEPADMKAELEGLAGLLHRDIMEVDLTVSHVCFFFFLTKYFFFWKFTPNPRSPINSREDVMRHRSVLLPLFFYRDRLLEL